ncbi:MAG: phytase [Deferribacterota bacterium]|nr:phytase [Deferribacterota bacterium]
MTNNYIGSITKYILLFFLLTIIGCTFNDDSSINRKVVKVYPSLETTPVYRWGDDADDMAIWIDEDNMSNSFIIGALKKEGIALYNLNGEMFRFYSSGLFNNVDVRYNYKTNNGTIDLVAATDRRFNGMVLFRIDKINRRLIPIATSTPKLKMKVYGLCMYHNKDNDNYYIFVTSKSGLIEQWKIVNSDKIELNYVRKLKLKSQVEGCVSDDEYGYLFVSEEERGLWKYNIREQGNLKPVLVDSADKGGYLSEEVEGVTIYYSKGGSGYIIVSSQGADRFDIYNRKPPHKYVGSFKIVDNYKDKIDGVSHTDGCDVINQSINNKFPYGFFIAQDDKNTMPDGHQNFKLVAWENIAKELNLIVDINYKYW